MGKYVLTRHGMLACISLHTAFSDRYYQYETERRKFAVDLIEFDHKWATMIMEKGGSPDGDEKIYE